MKAPLRLTVLGGLAVLSLAVLPLVGRQALPFSVLFDFGGNDPAAIIFWQITINIGMVTGMLPVVGIPLPLVSYGKTEMLVTLVSVGILLNLSREVKA